MKRLCEETDPRRPFIEPPSASSQVTARRRRRGLIEKRRRDRINDSLSELRRLVPPALDKHGSAKLEKAEILQMTVQHLKLLQAVRGKSHLDALDFLSLGFRECVTEVSRCLSDEPLRSRLLSHLSACASQRDAFAFASHQPHPLPWLRPFHTHHWNAPLRPLPAVMAPYGPSGSPDAGGGASPRAAGQSQSSVDSCPPSLAASPFSVSQSFPAALHGGFLPSAPQQQ